MLKVTNLHGFNSKQSNPVLTSISVFGSSTSSSSSITLPANIEAGDIIVLLDRSYGFGVPTTVIPSGFISISNIANAISARQIVSYKLAVGTEGSSSINGMSGSVDVKKAVYVFRGDIEITSVNISTPNGELTSGNPSSQNVAASGGTAPLVVLAGYGCRASSGSVNPRTFSPAKDGEISPATNLYLAYKIYNSSPSDVSIDMDDEGDENSMQSFYIEAA